MHIKSAITRIATTTSMMIKMVIPMPSSDGSNMSPHAILAPAFPTPSPSGVRSSAPAIISETVVTFELYLLDGLFYDDVASYYQHV